MSDSHSTSPPPERSGQPRRARGMSQSGQPRRPPARPSFQGQAPSAPPNSTIPPSQENRPGTSSFQGPPQPQYTYGARGGYVGRYTMPAQPSVGMVPHSQPQFGYPQPHPGLHSHDQPMLTPPQNQLMTYSQSTFMPMLQTPSQVYQYPPHAPEAGSSSNHGHSLAATPTAFSGHSRPQTHPTHPSPPPQSPLSHPNSGPPHAIPTSLSPHSTPFGGQGPYSPMRYSTPPFAYPAHSFAPSPPLYASQYPTPYPQQYPQPGAEQENRGAWYYFPPQPGSGQYESFQRPYAMSYSSVNTREVEQTQYGQPGSSPLTPSVFHITSPHPQGPSPGLTPSQGPTPIAASPQGSSYGQRIGDTSPTLHLQERPPDSGPVSPKSPMSPVSASASALGPRPTADRAPPVRRPYHPNPPAHRSEWVMWAGNVPSDATHDELWRFFNSPPSPGSGSGDSSSGAHSAGAHSTQSAPAGPVGSTDSSITNTSSGSAGSLFGGVASIFLITRSNCAFVNFTTEAHLHAAVMHFNGVPLRAGDARCPRLVCRVRGREDDLRAGVGAQRGAGMHVRWVKERKEREREEARRRGSAASESDPPPSNSPTDPAHLIGGLSLSSDEEGAAGAGRRIRKPEPHSSSSGSFASTSSSILTAYFPKRYFILKSLTQFDLDLSVEKCLWATQRHNEGILDQAFRTSKEVYLIFSVNKSGEFYGYAKYVAFSFYAAALIVSFHRMAGPIMRGEARVSWASRADSLQRRGAQQREDASQRGGTLLSPSEHRFGESPYPMSPDQPMKTPTSGPPLHHQLSQQQDRNAASAPAEMLQPHRILSQATMDDPQAFSYDYTKIRPVAPAIAGPKQLLQPEGIELDRMAPIRAIRDPNERVTEAVKAVTDGSLHPVAEEDEPPHDRAADAGKGKEAGTAQDDGPVWGESFKVEWVRTERLPFTRTRHIRNPWNHDREVKVSRDGTELEPSVGQQLLDEWDKLDQPPVGGAVDVDRRLQGKTSLSADALGPFGGS
ncbi:hypothetical protein GSI_15108 [Ganoderma sinense ZZ0214-1]|uniref:YTH domain-containing protein n=1 Tax=Ganoderma sinense ZZ0214-1 TaxID=1077348 RepID=A0A2G8RLN6_9APHY|nr:hypothetical protein GSI_15108 [Ganoderma sinense ZZ0214-1]